ncbi:MAG: hypothetical protein FJY60_01005 [Betaproteobacteria bacterium]|nr:hypothetical protein [Betaproteobacteria bacterium]
MKLHAVTAESGSNVGQIIGTMPLHVQTTIFMICMAYLVLHGAIWFALSEQRNAQVRLWCISGLVSGVSVVLLSLRGTISEFAFI